MQAQWPKIKNNHESLKSKIEDEAFIQCKLSGLGHHGGSKLDTHYIYEHNTKTVFYIHCSRTHQKLPGVGWSA